MTSSAPHLMYAPIAGRAGKSALVLFYHVISSCSVWNLAIWLLYLTFICLSLIASATHMY